MGLGWSSASLCLSRAKTAQTSQEKHWGQRLEQRVHPGNADFADTSSFGHQDLWLLLRAGWDLAHLGRAGSSNFAVSNSALCRLLLKCSGWSGLLFTGHWRHRLPGLWVRGSHASTSSHSPWGSSRRSQRTRGCVYTTDECMPGGPVLGLRHLA